MGFNTDLYDIHKSYENDPLNGSRKFFVSLTTKTRPLKKFANVPKNEYDYEVHYHPYTGVVKFSKSQIGNGDLKDWEKEAINRICKDNLKF